MATINGTSGNDSLTGNDGVDDVVNGLDGNDTLNGLTGNDTLDGGYGDDLYIVDSAGDVTTDLGGNDTVNSSVTYTLGANIDSLSLVGIGAMDGYGNELNNTLSGNGYANRLEGEGGNDTLFGGVIAVSGGSGSDTLDGGAGDDSMVGGAGDDYYYADSTSDVVTELANEGNDTVQSSMTFTLGDNVENLLIAGATGDTSGYGNALNNVITGDDYGSHLEGADGDDTLNGNGGDDVLLGGDGDDLLIGGFGTDTLDGGDGNDTLVGGAGANSMIGGDGDDLFVVDSSEDVAIEAADGGDDTVDAGGSYHLGANIENLNLDYGTGIGNALANEISANGGASVRLVGRGGNDMLAGGGYADVLLGGAGNDHLIGGSGYGETGDTMVGGTGDDVYEVNSDWDRVVERAGEGNDTVRASIDFSLGANFENLVLTGEDDLFGDGNDSANFITGNSGDNLLSAGGGNDNVLGEDGNDLIEGGAGNDTIDGGEGSDIMIGGEGNDAYFVDSSRDMTLEDAGEGTDKVVSSISWTLDDDVEQLQITGDAQDATGNALANTLTGNAGNNTLDGKGGADTMLGGYGDDLYVVNVAGDVVTEALNAGMDTVRASASYSLATAANVENLVLTGSGAINGTGNGSANLIAGNSGANLLDGAGGADTLVGGAGHDTLTGGSGADSFRWAGPLAGAHSDTISDFVHLTDHIDLNASIFTALSAGNLPGIAFRSATNITATGGNTVDADDRILYDSDSGNLYYDTNGNEAGGRTLIFTLATHPATLSAADIRVFSDE